MNKDLKLYDVTFKEKPKYIREERNKIFPLMLKLNFNIAEKTRYGVQILHI